MTAACSLKHLELKSISAIWIFYYYIIIIIKADKSTNFYKLDVPEYKRLLEANVTKTYRKADIKQLTKIDEEARTITKKLNIDDRVESMAMKEAFITLKDHKENFENKPTCRLINPSKPEIWRKSKQTNKFWKK